MDTVITVPVDESLASFIGKRGSANSIIFYNRKIENNVIVILFPSQEEDKIYGLAESLLISSQVVLSTASLDKKFGEALVASSLIDRKILITDENDVAKLVADSGISNYKIVERSNLLDEIVSDLKGETNPVRIDIDKAFPVKGIGTVVLGIVKRGTVRQHDKLFHSSGKQVTIRSIQTQDQDVASAGKGARVGLALKDIESDQVSKGDIFSQSPIGKTGRITVDIKVSKIAKEILKENTQYGIAANFSYTECSVLKVDGTKAELGLKTNVPIENGDEIFLIRKEAPRIFASGKVLQTQ